MLFFLVGTEVLVGGGMTKEEDEGDGVRVSVTTTTEIYNLNTGEWRNGEIANKYKVTLKTMATNSQLQPLC